MSKTTTLHPVGSAAEADARLGDFIDQKCICRNCIWVTDRPEPEVVTCKHPEGALIDGIPHADWMSCKCHQFADLVLEAELKTLMEDHYNKAEAEGLFARPELPDHG